MTNPKAELETLFRAEYGEVTDLVMRFIGITAGGALLYLYTGWAMSYLWGAVFLAVHAVQYPFLKARLNNPTELDAVVGGWLFVFVHVSFIWLPTYLAGKDDPALMLVGLLVLVATAMYHLRRADTQKWLVVVQILIFACSLVYIAGASWLRTDQLLVQVAIVMVTAMAVIYIALTMLSMHRKQIELDAANQRLFDAQKMSAMGRLAGGVAHDFNNILTVILGNLDLHDEIDDDVERRAVLAEARKAADRAKGVVQQLLVYARKSRPTLARVDAARVVEEFFTMGKALVPERISFQLEIAQDQIWVELDERHLSSALLNLLNNSIDAIDGNGTVIVGVGVQDVLDDRRNAAGVPLPAGRCASVWVRDTGHGIPVGLMSVVKDPFFTTKGPDKGTGLGLAMVSGFVESMAGGMTIQSSDQGTQVAMLFPVSKQGHVDSPVNLA